VRRGQPMRVLAVHGVGHQEATPDDWQPLWTRVIRQELQAGGGAAPDIQFAAYDELFEPFIANWNSTTWALALLSYPALVAVLGNRFTALNDSTGWQVGMVLAWLTHSDLRDSLRNRMRNEILLFQPDVIIAHSLGSDIVYDTLIRDTTLFPRGILVSGATQIAYPVMASVLPSPLTPIPQLAQWWQLYNANDHVFTEPLDTAAFVDATNFRLVETTFGNFISSPVANHDMVPPLGGNPENAYLTHPNTGAYVWSYLRGLNPPPDIPIPLGFPGDIDTLLLNPRRGSMPDKNPKLIMYFENGKFSWEEIHHYKANTALATVLAQGKLLAPARAACMASDVKLVKLMASNEEDYRDAVHAVVNLTGPATAGTSERIEMCIQVDLLGGIANEAVDGSYTSIHLLRGAPDSVLVTPAPAAFPPKGFGGTLQTYINALKGAQWGFFATDKNPATSPKVQIANVVIAAGVATITTQVPHLIQTGNTIQITGNLLGPDKESLNGTYKTGVTVTNATTFTIPTLLTDPQLVRAGKVQAKRKTVVKYLDGTYINIVRKKCGAGWNRAKGRTKTRK
jgi:hypothetical protein